MAWMRFWASLYIAYYVPELDRKSIQYDKFLFFHALSLFLFGERTEESRGERRLGIAITPNAGYLAR
jgi:hypothetical protein